MRAIATTRRYFAMIAGFLAVAAAAIAQAQTTNGPSAYSLTETNAMFGPPLTVEIHRDGSMALLDSSTAAGAGQKVHTRTLYDLRAGKSYTFDLEKPSTACSTGNFSGDWGDPFAMSAEVLKELAGKTPKVLGTETVAGVATKVMEVPDPKMTAKVWLDEKDSLVMKLAMAPPGGAQQTMIEVKQFTPGKQPANLFAVPAGCGGAASASAQPTGGKAGNAADYSDAMMPPPSKNACNVVFKVVQASTMQPLTSGFQVAVDTQVDTDHMPSYSSSISQGGRYAFSGGHIHEVTAQMQNGVLHLNNVPPQFNMDVAFGQGGDSSALIYRQCYGPETTLLLVVKNPKKLSDGADWLWGKK